MGRPGLLQFGLESAQLYNTHKSQVVLQSYSLKKTG